MACQRLVHSFGVVGAIGAECHQALLNVLEQARNANAVMHSIGRELDRGDLAVWASTAM